MPVANLTPAAADSAAPLSQPAVSVALKLKNGVRQIIGANSTESKLYPFLIDPRGSGPGGPNQGVDRVRPHLL